MNRIEDRRVVITGIGVLSPGAIGTSNYWKLISSGTTATRTISLFNADGYRSRVAAEVDFVPEFHGLTPLQIRRLDRADQFGLVCLREAIADSGIEIDEKLAARTGVSIGTAIGASTSLDQEYSIVSNSGRDWLVGHTDVVPQLFEYMVPVRFAADIAWEAGAEGPATVVSTGCTSGLDAVGYAFELIRDGSADVMIAGATEAPITPITVACFDAIRATSPNNDDPKHASRPFDRDRDGFVLGEGAAVFVLETMESATRRGAHIYAEISGFAGRGNAYHMTGLKPDGREMAEAIDVAMRQAHVTAEDVDYINAHGSGTKQNDRHETAAFKRSLGDAAYRIPVSSIKSMIGHSLGAIGSIELAACALAIEHDVVPPTANYETPDPECDLDYVPKTAREKPVNTVLSVGSGFGGFQSAVVLTAPRGSAA
jgi:minimal PKS ketosynthase (KS/KS alpha)